MASAPLVLKNVSFENDLGPCPGCGKPITWASGVDADDPEQKRLRALMHPTPLCTYFIEASADEVVSRAQIEQARDDEQYNQALAGGEGWAVNVEEIMRYIDKTEVAHIDRRFYGEDPTDDGVIKQTCTKCKRSKTTRVSARVLDNKVRTNIVKTALADFYAKHLPCGLPS